MFWCQIMQIFQIRVQVRDAGCSTLHIQIYLVPCVQFRGLMTGHGKWRRWKMKENATCVCLSPGTEASNQCVWKWLEKAQSGWRWAISSSEGWRNCGSWACRYKGGTWKHPSGHPALPHTHRPKFPIHCLLPPLSTLETLVLPLMKKLHLHPGLFYQLLCSKGDSGITLRSSQIF